MAQEYQQPIQNEVTPHRMDDGGTDEAGKVDRIRDILFGPQMRDYDGRFQRLEDNLAHEASEVRADTQKRLEALERFIKGEVDSINTRAAAEHGERCNANDKLGRDLAETSRNLDTKVSNLSEQTAKNLGELRELLLEQSKVLSGEIKEKYDQMKAGLEHEAAQIRSAMTGREALAEMLSEVALRLKNEFRIPGV
jgi:septation ring formation regulator EzrA